MMEIRDTFRGGHDAEIKTPKASRRERYRERVSPSPSDYGVWGLSSGVRGRAPAEAENVFGAF